MCGIAGFIGTSEANTRKTLDSMVDVLSHRGPDDRGARIYTYKDLKIGLGHTRLSIIDTSKLGNQPFEYKHLSITYNGEVYNYNEIKEELISLGHQFISHSDTEVILHSFEEWGVDCIHRFIGMFAFVVLDKKVNNVYAFRDRVGVKPFFYYKKDAIFLFASELKAFHRHPDFAKEINLQALYSFFDYGHVPNPYCIFENAHKLTPGCYLLYDIKSNDLTIRRYWDSDSFYTNPKLKIDYPDAKIELKKKLHSAYNYRMIADVPIGIFLSGGYDSTSVAAILQNSTQTKIKTFTIGFNEGNNEAPYAKKIAEYLGTEHHEYYCTSRDAESLLHDLPYYYDEPFADSSSIPTMIVSRFAKKEVSVALSADGGDEIFCGYDSYPKSNKRMKCIKNIPFYIRPALKFWLKMASGLIPLSQHKYKHHITGIAESLHEDNFKTALGIVHKSRQLPKHIKKRFVVNTLEDLQTSYNDKHDIYQSITEMLMAVDFKNYLPNDVLTKVDRATMSISLEGREPMLDHRIFEFVAQLPLSYKYDGVTTKRILKDITHDYIPKEMMDRPKKGFSLPIAMWLRRDMGYLLDEYLNEDALSISGILNSKYIKQHVQLFKEGNFHYTPYIWKLLMFQMWYKKWM